MINEVSLSWIAAFWEGEGNAGVYGNGKRLNGKQKSRLDVEIFQNNPKPLHWIKDVTELGRIGKKANGYRWRVRDKKAKEFLSLIYPYLQFRQDEVTSLIK